LGGTPQQSKYSAQINARRGSPNAQKASPSIGSRLGLGKFWGQPHQATDWVERQQQQHRHRHHHHHQPQPLPPQRVSRDAGRFQQQFYSPTLAKLGLSGQSIPPSSYGSNTRSVRSQHTGHQMGARRATRTSWPSQSHIRGEVDHIHDQKYLYRSSSNVALDPEELKQTHTQPPVGSDNTSQQEALVPASNISLI